MQYTPKYATVEDLKKHSYISTTDEDDLLALYLCSAEQTVTDTLQVKSLSAYIGDDGVLPAQIYTAILMQAAALYENREGISSAQQHVVPYANVMALLGKIINYGQLNKCCNGGR